MATADDEVSQLIKDVPKNTKTQDWRLSLLPMTMELVK
jgi:hypothetical protein